MKLEATIIGNVPSKSNSYKVIPRGLIKSTALNKYEESFLWQVGAIRNTLISTPFEFYVDIYYPSKRSDLDNSLKIILDCLQRAKIITNDNNCCKIVARKFIDKETPRLNLIIIPL